MAITAFGIEPFLIELCFAENDAVGGKINPPPAGHQIVSWSSVSTCAPIAAWPVSALRVGRSLTQVKFTEMLKFSSFYQETCPLLCIQPSHRR